MTSCVTRRTESLLWAAASVSGVLPHVIEVAVNHQSGHKRGPAGIYNRSKYAAEVQKAVFLWDRHVTALIEGREEQKVVPIRSAGDNS
jgi:hypothetical protein